MTVVCTNLGESTYGFTWNTSGLASGNYFARLQVAQYNLARKLLLLK